MCSLESLSKIPTRSSDQCVAHLHDAVADGAVLPLPQKHQTDHNHSCYGHRYHQQTNQCAAAEAEVLFQGPEGPLTDGLLVTGEKKHRARMRTER